MIKNKIIFLFLLLPVFICAQRSNIKFDHITIKDGLSQSNITSIIQDYKGLMWFGTQDGLNVYNGYEVDIFYHDALDSSSISNNSIHVVYEDIDSSLWVGTENGLNIFDRSNQTFTNVLNQALFNDSKNNVWTIATDYKKEYLWVGTDNGLVRLDRSNNALKKINLKLSTINEQIKIRKLLFINDEELLIATQGNGLILFNINKRTSKQFYTENSSLKSDVVWNIHIDTRKEITIATEKGINTYNSTSKTISSLDALDNIIGENSIKTIKEDKSGIIWIGTEKKGLYKLKSIANIDHYVYSANRTESLSSNSVNVVFEDNSKIIWVGTPRSINKFDKQKQYFRHHQYLPYVPNTINNNMVLSIFKDKEDNLLIGTQEGLNIFDKTTGRVSVVSPEIVSQELHNDNSIYCILQDKKNRIYVGTGQGLFKLEENHQLIAINKEDFVLNQSYQLIPIGNDPSTVFSLLEDYQGRLWVGTQYGLVLYSKDRKKRRFFPVQESTKNGLSHAVILSILQTKNKTIWLGTDGGGLCKIIEQNGQISFKTYQQDENQVSSISSNSIYSLYEDSQENLWVGTSGGGLNKFNFETEQFKHYTEKDGLANNTVYSIEEDRKGLLWLSTDKGISSFNRLGERFKNFEESDGLQSNEFNRGTSYKSADHELFFGGINGFNAFFPEDIHINESKPVALITDFYLFNKPVKIGEKSVLKKHISELDQIVLEYKQNVISFEFAALHYAQPMKNQHQYMLENFDENWISIGNNRRANYTNLDPGEYVFKVRVSNSDDVWSEQFAQIKVIVKPPFWRTWWFILITYILLPLAIIYAAVMSRINGVKAQKLLLELQVRERTHEVLKQKEEIESQKQLIEIEKDKTDELLLNILPQETADELKSKGKATARKYRMSSVMFTDFKSFTKIAETIKPEQLVSELDNYFKSFDEIIEKYDIEKIKTIGDAYMCAGGIPIRNKSNPIETVLAGLEIQRFVKAYNKKKEKQGEKGWGLRIGIHTGSVIAGVVGLKRFAYDIWGDSVNIASRIEAASNIGKVNISEATYELVKEFFVCDYRGKIKAKNKGHIDMYFVHCIRPELSVDGAGIEPNDLFQKYVDLHIYSGINYRKAEKYILDLLEKELPENLHYHSIRHTRDVCAAVERLALMEGIEGDDIFLLKTAAQYHDAGFIKQYTNNEAIGAALAREALPNFGYTAEQIATIERLIMATKVPQKPKDHLEQIICDADLDYLGGDEFHFISDKLKRELMERSIVENDKQWDELQISFLEAHTYFTKTAIRLRKANKKIRIHEIKERLKTYE